ncbi:type IV pilin [Methanosarcina sp.]|uniref:type IV pilin n=1 Tax=Methanosarcina sp. TaxID=2213 RepID=UPI003BB6E774
MDLKKLFKNKDEVSPVIGVILMLAITVILAAISSSTVTDLKPASPSSEATIEITANAIATATTSASVKFDHLGGDPISFGDPKVTKVTASLNGAESVPINTTGLDTLSVGNIKILALASDDNKNAFGTGPVSGDNVNIRIIDVKTNQIISSNDVRF